MEISWWLYGSIALVCALLILLIKVVEHKFMEKDDDLGMMSFIIGLIGLFAAYQAAEALKLFS